MCYRFSAVLTCALFLCSVSIFGFSGDEGGASDQLNREGFIAPNRIVSGHDITFTLPLLELGASVVGSFATLDQGELVIRGLDGLDVDVKDEISFVGSKPLDLEKIALLKPDLLILREGDSWLRELHAKIAPSVYIPHTEALEVYSRVAEVIGKTALFEKKQEEYFERVQILKESVSLDNSPTFSIVIFRNGQARYARKIGVLWQVLVDLGLKPSKLAEHQIPASVIPLSAEALMDIDADIIFQLYDQNAGETPEAAISAAESIFPNYCHFLEGCRKGMRVMVPHDESFEVSFQGLNRVIDMLQPILLRL